MADLGSGFYHEFDQMWKLLGKPVNATRGDLAARSNVYSLGISTAVDQAVLATKKGIFAAVPVQAGDPITKVSTLIGATAGETMANTVAAVYSGLPTLGLLLGQSKTSTAATLTASKRLDATLESPIYPSTDGYVYAGFIFEGATIPTCVGTAVKTGAQYEWWTGMPKALAVEGTLKEAGVAEAKLTATASEKVPFIFLW